MTAVFQLSNIVFSFSMGSYKFLCFLAPPQRAPTVIFKFQGYCATVFQAEDRESTGELSPASSPSGEARRG